MSTTPPTHTHTHSLTRIHIPVRMHSRKEKRSQNKNKFFSNSHSEPTHPSHQIIEQRDKLPPPNTDTNTRTYAYSLTHSHSQISPIAFFHLPYLSPPGRPAQRSAAAGIHPCPQYLHTWRLCSHSKHTVSERGRGGKERKENERGEGGTRKKSDKTDRNYL